MQLMHERVEIMTPLTVKTAMGNDPGLAALSARDYLANLAGSAPVFVDIKTYARLLNDLAACRGLIVTAGNIKDRALAAPNDAIADQLGEAVCALETLCFRHISGAAGALRPIDVMVLGDRPTPERRWWDADRIPSESVTLLSGDGGVGKTTLVQQAAVAGVVGREWLSQVPEKGPVLCVFCEDDEDELHRRFSKIAAQYSVSFKAPADGGLFPVSLAGKDAILAVPDSSGIIRPTGLYSELLARARDIRPKLIVLDNSADLFAGNENDRSQVRQFIALLRRISMESHSAVLLSSHPSLTGMHTGSGTSGSTAWNARVSGPDCISTSRNPKAKTKSIPASAYLR